MFNRNKKRHEYPRKRDFDEVLNSHDVNALMLRLEHDIKCIYGFHIIIQRIFHLLFIMWLERGDLEKAQQWLTTFDLNWDMTIKADDHYATYVNTSIVKDKTMTFRELVQKKNLVDSVNKLLNRKLDATNHVPQKPDEVKHRFFARKEELSMIEDLDEKTFSIAP